MSVARRPLLTAVAASALLLALWFVPTVHGSSGPMTPAADARTGGTAAQPGRTGASAAPGDGTTRASDTLAVTGVRQHITPFLFGGTVVLGCGAGFVVYSVRRGRATGR